MSESSNTSGGVSDRGDEEEVTGFIFLCNGQTKEDCYRFRVFGVPGGRMKMVEKIKPGMKLFLFDFDTKLLYGAYEATSSAVFNLQPTAFNGMFPAQVGFKIYKDCLPLQENSFKFALQNIYQNGKFKQELNFQQVTTLLSLFHPITMAASVHQPVSLPISGRPLNMSQSAASNPHQITVRLPHLEKHYMAGMQFRQQAEQSVLPSLNMTHTSNNTGAVTQFSNEEQVSGFIFLCNGQTKEDCYRFRVFGLPGGRMKVVEKIKSGMKLFLFDFDAKLLYGVYEATSSAIFNLQPSAFDGKFPVQVGFKIYKDCLPLPENSFKFAIENIYHNGKFKQELNFEQVTILVSLFRPLSMAASVHQPVSLPISGRPLNMSQSAADNLLQIPLRSRHLENHYMAGMQFGLNSTSMEPQNSQNVVYSQYGYHGASVNPYHTQTLVGLESNDLSAAESLHVPYVPAMQHNATPTESIPQQAEQSFLPSQSASYGAEWDVKYDHYYQSNYSTGAQQAYLVGNYTPSHLDPYWRNAGNMFSSDNQLGSRSDYPMSLPETENATTVQQIHAVHYYNLHSVPTSSHAPPQQ